ncbi:MAG: tetraacyldisaccharide 4'-kinase [Fimbriimonadales bacterium]|nr:tetraacyldisaccharide 4'-kinase [Fimbriimonadales bacterium]
MAGGWEQRVWYGRALRFRTARAALAPLALLYAVGWEAYLAAYRSGLKRPRSPHRPVVCVGNLVVGGSGKSPTALHVAQVLRSTGRPAVLSCSGYGSPRQRGASWAPEGDLDPAEWGDEPAMARWLMPDLPLVVGRDRVAAAALCAQRAPDAVLVLDDGLQHLPLRKHATIALDDPAPTNRLCLPAGPYREPRWNRSRADLILPGRFDLACGGLRFVDAESDRPTEAPKDAWALCAIARPDRFADDLRAAGVGLRGLAALTDHDPLSAGNLLDGVPPGSTVVVTAKDWVKLRRRPDLAGRRWVVALRDVSIQPAEEFRRWLVERLHEAEAE